MKFAIITDIHHGPPNSWIKKWVQRKLVTHAKEYTQETIAAINSHDDLSFLLNMWDLIEDVNDPVTDIEFFKEARGLFDILSIPHKYVIGNHDQKTLDTDTLLSLTWLEKLYYSFEYDNFKFIILKVEYISKLERSWKGIASLIPNEQLIRLKNELDTNKKCVVISHYPLSDVDLRWNFRFEDREDSALVYNRAEVRKMISTNSNVIACFHWHIHCNNITYHDNIPYITQQSLSENFLEKNIPSKTYSIVELTEKELKIRMFGNDRINFTHNF